MNMVRLVGFYWQYYHPLTKLFDECLRLNKPSFLILQGLAKGFVFLPTQGFQPLGYRLLARNAVLGYDCASSKRYAKLNN